MRAYEEIWSFRKVYAKQNWYKNIGFYFKRCAEFFKNVEHDKVWFFFLVRGVMILIKLYLLCLRTFYFYVYIRIL